MLKGMVRLCQQNSVDVILDVAQLNLDGTQFRVDSNARNMRALLREFVPRHEFWNPSHQPRSQAVQEH